MSVERLPCRGLDSRRNRTKKGGRAIRRGFLIAPVAVFLACILAPLTPSFATEVREFDVPGESAEYSLPEFARQAHVALLFDFQVLGPFKTHSVKGRYQPAQALQRMLQGTGLEFSFPTDDTVSVKPKREVQHRNPPKGPTERELSLVNIIASRVGAGSSGLPAGVSIRRVTAEDLSRSGVTTLADWARALPENEGSGATEETHDYLREAGTNTAFGSGMNLRGLGSRATLILVNGKRLAPSGSAGTFTDIANIPITAVDHIDVISDGAAVLYGADAIGGIVNFVLRTEASPAESVAVFGHLTRSLGEQEFAQSMRKAWGDGGGLVSFEYYERDELPASERSQATSDLRPWGGSNWGSYYGNPATILDSEGRLWSIPSGQNGKSLTASELIPGPDYHDRYSETWILPHQERLSLLATTEQQVGSDSLLNVDVLLNRRRFESQGKGLTAALAVPTTNPFYVNPVAGSRSPIEVLYGFGDDLGPETLNGRVDTGQLTAGFTHQLSQTWTLQSGAGYAFENQRDEEGGLVDFGALQQYLNSSDPTVAFDPFGDGSTTNPTTLAAIRSSGRVTYKSAFRFANVGLAGPVLSLPAGPVQLTVGSDYRLQTFRTLISPTTLVASPATDSQRSLIAVFAQSNVPLLAPDPTTGQHLKLDMSFGLRYEHYSGVGGALSPQMGFSFSPSPSVSVQGTWMRLFRPPNLPDLNESNDASGLVTLADPHSATGYTTVLVWSGNNAALRPETAQSWALGVSFSPVVHPEFSTALSYFSVLSSNRVYQPTSLPLTVLSDPQYSVLVARTVTEADRAQVCSRSQFFGSPGDCLTAPIGALVDTRLRNIETLQTDGLDFTAQYSRPTRVGDIRVGVDATYILQYRQSEAPDAPLVELRDTPHNPPGLRLQGSIGWERHGFFASTSANIQGGYHQPAIVDAVPTPSPARSVDSWTTWDMVLGYRFARAGPTSSAETQISVRGQNIFNQFPPFLNNAVSGIGYDEENGDLLGRRVDLSVRHRW